MEGREKKSEGGKKDRGEGPGEGGELGRDRGRKGKCVKEGSRQGGRELISMRQPRTGLVEAVRPDQSHFNGNVGRASSHASAWK